MAIEFYSAIDLNGNQLQNTAIHKVSSAPGSPTSGQMYYNTTANTLHYHNGTGWQTVGTSSGSMTAFILEDDDGTEVSISDAEEVKFIGSGITTNWTDTSHGSDGDPFDLTFTVDAAQTGITSILATDLKIGEDDQTKIDFETADEIHFYANNTEQVYLADNIFGPESDSDVDLGTSSVRWKDAYVDSITVTGEVDGASLDISGDADIDGTLEADAITVNGTALNTVIAGVTVTNSTNAAHVLITDNESTDEENEITFIEGAGGGGANRGLEADGDFTYNPSSGTVSATVFKGNIDAVDGDFDGTLEADAITVGGTALNTVIAGVTVSNASLAATATVTDSTANTNFPVVFNNESDALLDDTGSLYYNPSTGLLTVPNLSVAGTTTQVNTVTMNAENAVVFEGATADGYETTLTVVDPTVDDNTIYLPDATGYIPLIADASTADGAVTAAEFALLDGGSTVATGAFANGDGLLHNDGGTMKQTNVSSLATLFAGAGMTATSSVVNVIGGDGITANANDVAVTAAQTTITSVLNTGLVIGRDADNDIDFATDNQIIFRVGGADNVIFKASGEIEATSLDISGDADIDGTLETDALTIGGSAVLAQATASAVGAVELATAAEVLTGTDAARVVTADTLSAKSVVCTIAQSSLTDDLRATITHSLGDADTIVQLYDMTTEAQIFADIARTTDDMSTASTSVITVDFGTSPPNDVRVVITSLAGATAGSVAYT